MKFKGIWLQLYEKVIGPLVTRLADPLEHVIEGVSKSGPVLDNIVDMLVGLVTKFGDWINDPKTDLKTTIEDFIKTVEKVIKVTIAVVKIVFEITKFVTDNWSLVKNIVLSLIAILGGTGLYLALVTTISLLNKFAYGIGNVLGVIAKLAGFGGSAAGSGAVGEGAAAGGAEVAEAGVGVAGETAAVGGAEVAAAGVGEEVAAGGLAALVGGEAATGVGIPVAVATALLGGGYLLWRHYHNKNKEDEEKRKAADAHVETTSFTKSEDLDNSVDNLQNINDTLAVHSRLLKQIADNTEMNARFARKTVGALA